MCLFIDHVFIFRATFHLHSFSPCANDSLSAPSLCFCTLLNIIISKKSTNFLDILANSLLVALCKRRCCWLWEGLGSGEKERSNSFSASTTSSCRLWATRGPLAVWGVFSGTASSADVAWSQLQQQWPCLQHSHYHFSKVKKKNDTHVNIEWTMSNILLNLIINKWTSEMVRLVQKR